MGGKKKGKGKGKKGKGGGGGPAQDPVALIVRRSCAQTLYNILPPLYRCTPDLFQAAALALGLSGSLMKEKKDKKGGGKKKRQEVQEELEEEERQRQEAGKKPKARSLKVRSPRVRSLKARNLRVSQNPSAVNRPGGKTAGKPVAQARRGTTRQRPTPVRFS